MADFKFIDDLAYYFEKLPGVGKKTANRYAYALIEKMSLEESEEFAKQIVKTKRYIKKCSICGMYTLEEKCTFCKDELRDHSTIMVVKDPKDILTVEYTKQYHGLYHALGGLINPLAGDSIKELNIDNLFSRIDDSVKEVIIATPFSQEGETTAIFLENILVGFPITVSRISFGLPAGGDIEYVDEMTLKRSIDTRIKKEPK